MEAIIQQSVFESLKHNPFFFMRLDESIEYDDHGHRDDNSEYVSVDKEINISIKAEVIEGHNQSRHKKYYLCVADLDQSDIRQNNPDSVDLHFHNVSLKNLSDATQVFDMYLKHLGEQEHRYAYLELLWLLNDGDWGENHIKNALRRYNPNSIPSLCGVISDVGRCLSIKKQHLLQNALSEFGFDYQIYNPSIIQDALSKLGDDLIHDQSDNNLYQTVDLIIKNATSVEVNTEGNPLLDLVAWLKSENSFTDYQQLINVFSLVSESIRLSIVKRWFHDIRLGHTTFDHALLEQFKDNRFNEFIKYRYCIASPGEPIVLTVPLLCDNILTLFNTGGQNFLSFDGVLDFAITHCDTAHPNIDFKMHRFLPKCDGGAQISRQFCGFISYKLISKLDETKLGEENVLAFIKQRLDEYGTKKSYYACKFGDGSPLDDEQRQHCFSRRINKREDAPNQEPETAKYDCCESRSFEDRWIISSKEKIDLIKNHFLNHGAVSSDGIFEVDISMISANQFIGYIRQLPLLKNFEAVGENEYLIPPFLDDSLDTQIVDSFFTIDRMRIYPNKTIVAGLRFDLFGIRNRLFEKMNRDRLPIPDEKLLPEADRKELNHEHERQESLEVHERIIRVLSTDYELGEYHNDGNYFEEKYDAELLNEIKLRFYYHRNVRDNDTLDVRSFLESRRYSRLVPFCAPKLAETRSTVLDLPFFWCQRGKECYHNCLENQTLSRMNDWRQYTLFHLIEIISFPKINQTEAGNEPDGVIRQLVAVTNKVMQKYRRLKCRGCGHLLFTVPGRNGNFNQHYFFACANLNCSEYNHEVYLNHCYSCGRGLIDSRDHAQCPNGWYICPDCKSCCDNALFERLAQRYIVTHRPVPNGIQRFRGHGHADQNMHFCPKCGALIENYQDNQGDVHFGCPQCHIDYEI